MGSHLATEIAWQTKERSCRAQTAGRTRGHASTGSHKQGCQAFHDFERTLKFESENPLLRLSVELSIELHVLILTSSPDDACNHSWCRLGGSGPASEGSPPFPRPVIAFAAKAPRPPGRRPRRAPPAPAPAPAPTPPRAPSAPPAPSAPDPRRRRPAGPAPAPRPDRDITAK